MGIWGRRSLGLSVDHPVLDQSEETTVSEQAEQEWEHLLNCDDDERLQRAKVFREG
jgi:hypothetical protein